MVDFDYSSVNLKKQRVEKKILHWLAYAFYTLAIVCALWQHGHAALTLVLLVSAIPAALFIYMPSSVLSFTSRIIMQFAIALTAILWGVYRYYLQTPVDRLLIESICIVGFCLAVLPTYKSYQYLFSISIVALIYGAVFPRTVFIYMIPFTFVLCIVFLFYTRPVALAGDRDANLPLRVFPLNWKYLCLYIGLVFIISAYLYHIFPSPGKSHLGFVVSSIRSGDNNYMPPEFRRWFASDYVANGGDVLMQNQGLAPREIGNSGVMVEGDGQTSINGNGGGTPGRDMVFRVQSPVKLYWLAQLYDVYNGKKWISSEEMQQQRVVLDDEEWNCIKLVRQNFVIEKWISPILYSSYWGNFYSTPGLFVKLDGAYYHKKLEKGSSYPQVPYEYNVASVIPNVKMGNKDIITTTGKRRRQLFWHERLKEARYLKLPDAISDRVKQLAIGLTASAGTDYEKALALRDYLRKNFTYKQFSEKVPEDKETVDHFLFELKEGHCEYFASALTVLARVNGLPARVATGFSPGNFNILNGFFEVHEYHAHAWCQIYIKGKGWLTFDGTPPGEIVSRTKPLGIGALNDPFGDEWRETPPELTKQTQQYIQTPTVDLIRSEASKSSDLVNDILAKIASFDEEPENESAQNEMMGAGSNAMISPELQALRHKKQSQGFLQRWLQALNTNVNAMFDRIKSMFFDFLKWLISLNGILCAVALAAIIGLSLLGKYVLKLIIRKVILKRCIRDYETACHLVHTDPLLCIKMCYQIIRKLLTQAGCPREHNLDLFDYGTSLKHVDDTFCKDVLNIFFLFSQAEYSPDRPNPDQAGKMLEYTTQVKNFLMDNML